MLIPALLVLLITRSASLAIAAYVIGVVAIVLVGSGLEERLVFLAILFISVGLKDAWDRFQRRRAVEVAAP